MGNAPIREKQRSSEESETFDEESFGSSEEKVWTDLNAQQSFRNAANYSPQEDELFAEENAAQREEALNEEYRFDPFKASTAEFAWRMRVINDTSCGEVLQAIKHLDEREGGPKPGPDAIALYYACLVSQLCPQTQNKIDAVATKYENNIDGGIAELKRLLHDEQTDIARCFSEIQRRSAHIEKTGWRHTAKYEDIVMNVIPESLDMTRSKNPEDLKDKSVQLNRYFSKLCNEEILLTERCRRTMRKDLEAQAQQKIEEQQQQLVDASQQQQQHPQPQRVVVSIDVNACNHLAQQVLLCASSVLLGPSIKNCVRTLLKSGDVVDQSEAFQYCIEPAKQSFAHLAAELEQARQKQQQQQQSISEERRLKCKGGRQ
eukprot:GEZU01014194.1.p1 GENE.GEZU01014194.1~~GEZU01014194.1.p1  ORF type:complete len:374 (+),score=92.10 GEZU01014194.1:67-1188(+)